LNLLAPEATICLAAVDRLRRSVNSTPGRKPSGIRRRARRSWATEQDEGAHILNAEIALYRAGIPFLQLPWQNHRFASRTFMVSNVAEARSYLLLAGFREKSESATLLIDNRNGRPIQLIKERPTG
jgi:hypothetical protein